MYNLAVFYQNGADGVKKNVAGAVFSYERVADEVCDCSATKNLMKRLEI